MSVQRYYWIKLREDFWDLPEIDWLQDQEKGCEYIVLFQKLCTLTANNGGELSRKVGEMVIAYDVKKIAALTRFDFDTVAVALELYKKIGLMYQNKKGILVIANITEMVGSEAESAARVRKFRNKQKALQYNADVTQNVTKNNVTEKRYSVTPNVTEKVTTDIDIDKEIDIRNKEKDIYSPAEPDNLPLPTAKNKSFTLLAKGIIDYLNAKLNTKYKTDNRKTLDLIKARLKEGFTVEDFKTVIDKKSFEWSNDPNMCQYLRPVTLFSTKFESYLNQPFTKQMTGSEKNVYEIANHEFKGDYFDD